MTKSDRRAAWIARVGTPLLRAVGATWRIRLYGTPLDFGSPQVVFAFLHGDMLMPAILFRSIAAAVLISRHGDGEIIARVLRSLGALAPVRGSTTRGGVRAFLELTRSYQHLPWAITPDGPKGPRGHVHEGVVQLAAVSGRPIICAGFAVDRGKHLSSWDRFVIPMPFTRIAGFLGEPMSIPADVEPSARPAYVRQLEERLRDAHLAATRALATW